jgi:hypothetical protein
MGLSCELPTACNLHIVSWANSVRSGHLADTPRTSAECPRLKADPAGTCPFRAGPVPFGGRPWPTALTKYACRMRLPNTLANWAGQASWPSILANLQSDFAQADLALAQGAPGSRWTCAKLGVEPAGSRRFGW